MRYSEPTIALARKLVRAEVDHGPRPCDGCLVEDADLEQLTFSAMMILRYHVRRGISYPRAYQAGLDEMRIRS